MPSYDDDSYVLIKQLYPVVAKSLDSNSSKFMNHINRFMNEKHDQIYDIAPYDRIYYNQRHVDDLFASLKITEQQVVDIIKNCFYWDLNYNPACAKEPYVVVLTMAIRYYMKKNNQKLAEITSIYLCFTGKFYCSLHAGIAFPKAPPSKHKEVMDYVVNNLLTDKYSLKKEGTVFGAIKAMCITWLETYKDIILSDKSSDEELTKKLIQQLRERERSFLMNIAVLYYEALVNQSYLNYETDNLDPDAFRLTNNDAATAARLTENTVSYMTSNYVSLDICNKCKDANVKATEIKDIMECILADNTNLPDLRLVINILICDFMRNYPGTPVHSVEFVSYSIKAKPNTKDEYLIKLKETVLKWLDENSPTYRRRKSRKATQISYYRSILLYIVLIIHKVAG